MSVFDIFRNVFGFLEGPNSFNIPDNGATGQFGNSGWSNDAEDEDDHLEISQHGFDIFSGPSAMHRYFEHQMSEMLKQFQMMQDPSMFGLTEVPALAPQEPYARNPRDEVLKPGYETIDGPAQKVDSDLDEHVAKFGLSSLLRGGYGPKLEVAVPNRITAQSVIRKVIRRADGSVEREEVVHDNAGNEQRTITHTIGNQSHSVMTITGPDGVHTSETLENIDQDKVDDFMKKWDSGKNQKPVVSPRRKIIPDDFPFDKFFK